MGTVTNTLKNTCIYDNHTNLYQNLGEVFMTYEIIDVIDNLHLDTVARLQQTDSHRRHVSNCLWEQTLQSLDHSGLEDLPGELSKQLYCLHTAGTTRINALQRGENSTYRIVST